jgi:hypothetical protein
MIGFLKRLKKGKRKKPRKKNCKSKNTRAIEATGKKYLVQ